MSKEPNCPYCRDTGHAGGSLSDPNQCGWCNTPPVVVKPDTGSWTFYFTHGDRTPSFNRYNMTYDKALEEAKCGFQWCYGYWPSGPVRVEEIKR